MMMTRIRKLNSSLNQYFTVYTNFSSEQKQFVKTNLVVTDEKNKYTTDLKYVCNKNNVYT